MERLSERPRPFFESDVNSELVQAKFDGGPDRPAAIGIIALDHKSSIKAS